MMRRGERGRAEAGFSLVEVALAIGVAAVSLVAILGLFPVAIRSGAEARRETLSAQIARSLLADLRSLPPDRARFWVGPGAEDFAGPFDLGAGPGSASVAFGGEGSPLGPVAGEFAEPSAEIPGAECGALVEWEPVEGGHLIRLTVTVERPLAAAEACRERDRFVTLLAR
jgi:hypothetical protein